MAVAYGLLDDRRARRSAAWANPAMLPNILRGRPGRMRRIPAALLLVGLTFLLVGFARPKRLLGRVSGGAPTIVLTFDVSSSMSVDDVRPTRIRATKSLALQFLRELPSRYRVAVVRFAEKPDVVVAPTFDRESVISELPSAAAPREGTAIGDAISESVAVVVGAVGETYPGDPHPSGAVLLFSDGGQNAGGTTLDAAADTAYSAGVPVDTVAVGTPNGVLTQPVKVDGIAFTSQNQVPVDPAILRQVSRQTSGTFFDAASLARSTAPLTAVYRNVGPHASPGRRTDELTGAAAAVALVFILGGIAVSRLWFGSVA